MHLALKVLKLGDGPNGVGLGACSSYRATMMGLLPLLLAAILFMFANCRENETAGFYLFGL